MKKYSTKTKKSMKERANRMRMGKHELMQIFFKTKQFCNGSSYYNAVVYHSKRGRVREEEWKEKREEQNTSNVNFFSLL